MKRFTDTQKKWALTATMIAVLGCSVSFNSNNTGNSSVDLASESEELMVPTNVKIGKEDIKVRLIKMSDKETTVVLPPQKNSEGKVLFECADCSTFVLNKKLRNDSDTIAEFQAEIVKKWTNTKEEKKEIVKAASDVKEDKEDREVSERDERREERRAEAKREKDEYQDDLDLLKDAAEDCRSESTKSEKLKCVIDAYSDTLSQEISFTYKNRKGKTVKDSRPLNPKAALEFYTKNIESGVKSDLRRTGGNSALYEVLASLPSDFNNVRQKALSSSTAALYEATVDYRDSIARAMQSRNPSDQVKAQQNQANLQQLNSSLSANNTSALLEASRRGNIEYSEARELFELGYERPASNLTDISSKWLTINSQGRIVPNLNSYPLPTSISGSFDGMDLSERLSNMRADGVLPAPGSNTTNPSNRSNMVAPVLLQQNSSSGAQFGQPRSLSPEALRASQDIRSQQGQAIWVQQ
jgi:hypothetical protein